MLEARLAEQRAVLDEGAALVKPGGRLAYITCSVLPPENRDQVDAFLAPPCLSSSSCRGAALGEGVAGRAGSLRPTAPPRRC